jgi:hypothetical protein
MIVTTLNRIRAHSPCADGWSKLLAGLGKTCGDDEPLSYADIVRINGINDALWCCRAEPQYEREWRLYAVWCALQARHLMTGSRSLAALDVANGLATNEKLSAAGASTWEPTWEAAWVAALATTESAAKSAQTAEFIRIVSQKDAAK